MKIRFSVVAGAITLASCTSSVTSLPTGPDAYSTVPAQTSELQPEYLIGPLDVLSIVVFGEPELSFKEIQVDASGNLRYPLIGSLTVAGRTPSQLNDLITTRLNERYLRNAQVTVVVTSSVRQRITVEGQVTEPGVYEIPGGSTTLLEAVARAKSPTRVAKLDQVVVFRMIDGERRGARFDLQAIRDGRAPDPELRGGDVVVVGYSSVKGVFRDFLTTAPFFNIFTRF